MGKKAAKSTRKFAKSGELKRTIQARRKFKAVKAKTQARKGAKRSQNEHDEEEEEEEEDIESPTNSKTVDDLLNGDLMDEQGDDESDDEEDAESLASMNDEDEEQDEEETHAMDLAQLQKTDPEFYKYLQENDRELLEFKPEEMEFEDDEDMEDTNEKPVLTSEILKTWQRSLIETHSLRTLRKLLVAFKAAAYMNDEEVETRWKIDSAAGKHISTYFMLVQTDMKTVFNKLVTTTLKYTPIIAAHHAPYKTLPGDKFKPPTTNATLSKLLLSHLYNAIRLIEQLPSNPTDDDEEGDDNDNDTPESKSKKSKKGDKKTKKSKKGESDEGSKTALVELALGETGKLIPWVVGSRKAVKMWLKTCLSLWSTSADSVRISAFLAVRRLSLSADEAVVELVLKPNPFTTVPSSPHPHPYISTPPRDTHQNIHPNLVAPPPTLTSYLSASKPKSAMLKPLDMASTIRAPSAYLKTHVLAESVVQEAVWLLAESVPLTSVAFPEVVFPIASTLKKSLKKKSSASAKVVQGVKALVEHLEEQSKWTTEQRKNVQFGPERWEEVERWEEEKGHGGPLERWIKVLRKQREGRRKVASGVVDT
ncbi:nucleolar complex protein 2 [Rhizoctonia solani]|uniref:Nucleolar complex protein 2 n=1 Tax=Rhizoctonia solani TaxID=456999 RepID=A0A8H8T1I2_9AGAM|nr:nucleolar complex protein 2 [Rhizoctonia solani]QRW26486.1 nucleolar complex protein 2 [Rhizoctonia solani]